MGAVSAARRSLNAVSASAAGRDDVSYLIPLFEAAAVYRSEGHFVLLPDPAAHSSLSEDDRPLGSRGAAKFVQSSFSAGLWQIDALTRLVTVARQIDPHSPWTLLRGALENFATAVWLLNGRDRSERRHRTLTLWAEDFRNRAPSTSSSTRLALPRNTPAVSTARFAPTEVTQVTPP